MSEQVKAIRHGIGVHASKLSTVTSNHTLTRGLGPGRTRHSALTPDTDPLRSGVSGASASDTCHDADTSGPLTATGRAGLLPQRHQATPAGPRLPRPPRRPPEHDAVRAPQVRSGQRGACDCRGGGARRGLAGRPPLAAASTHLCDVLPAGRRGPGRTVSV